MPVPDYETMMRPILQAFAEGAVSVSDTLPPLIKKFEITPEEAEELTPSGRISVLASRAHWARTYMAKAGFLYSPKRNHHIITELGRQVLVTHPDRIDNKVLSESAAFQKWKEESHSANGKQNLTPVVQAGIETDSALTPEDRIEVAAKEIEDALVQEVISAVLSLSSARFEQLVVDLLVGMGYGGGKLENGFQTSLSGDGGIDGVVNEDELGLDAVYVQAKRYAPENKVGRPALNAFVGSLTGEGASKGVFVTTSDFSKDAREYVARVQQRIVLINGDRLARLLIKHEVGVRARKIYVLRSVDEDYFSEQ